jgi:hypothetical protein
MITQVYETAAANSDADGNITFSFPAIPTDVWLVTLSVPAGLTGSFTATSNGVTYGQWQGVNGVGPQWIPGPSQITITGSNLMLSSPFVAVCQGSAGTMADIPLQAPTPTASSVQATCTQQPIITGTIGAGDNANITVALSPNWRSIYFGSNTGEVTLFGATGVQNGMNYPPILCDFGPQGTVSTTAAVERFSFFDGIDTSLTLPIDNTGGGTATYWVGADNDPTDLAVDANAGQPVAMQLVWPTGLLVDVNKLVTYATNANTGTCLITATYDIVNP